MSAFQRTPYSTSSAIDGPRVLTRAQRRRQQEAERPPPPHQSFVANPTISAGNEASSSVVEEV